MKKKQKNLESGAAMMVATIFFLIVSLTIIFGLAGPTVRAQKMTRELFSSRQSYFLAEAGVEDVAHRLRQGLPVDPFESLSLGGSTVTTVTTDVSGSKEVVATGEVENTVRKVAVELAVGEGVAFHYGIQIGNGGFLLGSNAGVNGNVYSNADITGQNGSFITGDAFAAGTVSGVDVAGETRNGVAIQGMPIPEAQIADWKSEAAAGGESGSLTLSGTANVLGPKKINGDLTLAIGSKLTLTGTLWVTGNFLMNNDADIVLSPAYGSAGGFVIVDGTSTLSNNSLFTGSGEEGSLVMLLSTNTGNAITLQNNAGAAVLYAPYGTVTVSNNAGINQVTAKTVSLSNNAVIDYEQGLVDTSFSSGPSGGYEIHGWEEIE